MELGKLMIDAQAGKLSGQNHRPEMQLKQPKAEMRIDQELAGNLSISTSASKLFIDQTEAFADAGLVNPLRQSLQWTSSAKSTVLSYISQKNQEGAQLQAIEHGGDKIKQIAKQNSAEKPLSYNIGLVPSSTTKVKFTHQPAKVNVEASWPDPTISFTKQDVQVHIPKWQREVYLSQKPAIHFSFINQSI